MNDSQRAAYVVAQSVAAFAEIQGMVADNQVKQIDKRKPTYGKYQFDQVIEKYGIHHNALLSFFVDS